MPHIHTGDGEFDFTVAGYIIHDNKTLLIKHKYLPLWTAPSGHIEVTQTPLDALYTEIKEESGITKEHLTLVSTGNDRKNLARPTSHSEMPLPFDIETHPISDNHSHINLSYILISDTNNVEPGPGESNTFKWFSLDELDQFKETNDSIKSAASYALRIAEEYQHERLQ